EAVARGLRDRGVGAGDRVVIAVAEGDAFLATFWGALRAGAVAVPLLPRSGAARLLEVATWLEAAGVVADDEPPARWQELTGAAATAPRWLASTDAALAPDASASPLPPTASADEVAFLQLTSGTTGEQKAVRIRHRDLETNVEQMREGFEVTAGDVFHSW